MSFAFQFNLARFCRLNSRKEKNDEDEVKAYIARFAGVTASEEVLDAAVGANPVELGKAPPCEAYEKLKPFRVLEESVERYKHCTQPSHMKDKCGRCAAVYLE